jgi:hypothetical protein
MKDKITADKIIEAAKLLATKRESEQFRVIMEDEPFFLPIKRQYRPEFRVGFRSPSQTRGRR